MQDIKTIYFILFIYLIGCREETKLKTSRVVSFSYGNVNRLGYSIVSGQVTYLYPEVLTSDSVKPVSSPLIMVITPDHYGQEKIYGDSVGRFSFSLPSGLYDIHISAGDEFYLQALKVVDYKADSPRTSHLSVRLVKDRNESINTDFTIRKINSGMR